MMFFFMFVFMNYWVFFFVFLFMFSNNGRMFVNMHGFWHIVRYMNGVFDLEIEIV